MLVPRPAALLAPVVGRAPTGPIDVKGLVELAELGLAPLRFDPDAVPVPPTPVVTTPTTDVGETAAVNLDLVVSLDAPSPFPIAQPEAYVPALATPSPPPRRTSNRASSNAQEDSATSELPKMTPPNQPKTSSRVSRRCSTC